MIQILQKNPKKYRPLQNILTKLYSKELLKIIDVEDMNQSLNLTNSNSPLDNIFIQLLHSERQMRLSGWRQVQSNLDTFLSEPEMVM